MIDLFKKKIFNKRTLFARKIVIIYLFLSVVFFMPVFNKSNFISGATKTEA